MSAEIRRREPHTVGLLLSGDGVLVCWQAKLLAADFYGLHMTVGMAVTRLIYACGVTAPFGLFE